jgi:hypothetical protein
VERLRFTIASLVGPLCLGRSRFQRLVEVAHDDTLLGALLRRHSNLRGSMIFSLPRSGTNFYLQVASVPATQTTTLSARNPLALRQRAVASLAAAAALQVAARLVALDQRTTTLLPQPSGPALQTLEAVSLARASRRRASARRQQLVEVCLEAAAPAVHSVLPARTPQPVASVAALAALLAEATTHHPTMEPPTLRSSHSRRRTVQAMPNRSTRPSPSSNRTRTTPSRSCA